MFLVHYFCNVRRQAGRQAGSVTGQKPRQKPTVDFHRRRLKSIGIRDLTTVVPLLVGSGDKAA